MTPRHCSTAVGRKPVPSPFPYNNIEFCLFRTSHLTLLCSVADSRSAVTLYCLIGIPELNCAKIIFRGPSSIVGWNKNVWMWSVASGYKGMISPLWFHLLWPTINKNNGILTKLTVFKKITLTREFNDIMEGRGVSFRVQSVAYPGILFGGGGVQQIQLWTEDRENGDLGAVAP